QLLIDQDTAVFRGHQIGAPSRGHPDFVAAAAHLGGYRADGVILANLTLFQLGYPNILHPLRFQHSDIFITDDMALRHQLFSARPKYSAAENPTVRTFDFDRFCYHGALTNELD